MNTSLDIAALCPTDRQEWEALARAYLHFYGRTESPARFDETWRRLMQGAGLYGFGARLDGKLLGITHYIFHANMWLDDVCYLQDLFIDQTARGQGLARGLILRVAEAAKERHAPRLYWLTAQDNTTARTLYDKVAKFQGFIRYDYPMTAS